MDLIKVEKVVADFAVTGVWISADGLSCSPPPSWAVELPSLYFCASLSARSRAEAMSNLTRSVLSWPYAFFLGRQRDARALHRGHRIVPVSVRPDAVNDTHTRAGSAASQMLASLIEAAARPLAARA